MKTTNCFEAEPNIRLTVLFFCFLVLSVLWSLGLLHNLYIFIGCWLRFEVKYNQVFIEMKSFVYFPKTSNLDLVQFHFRCFITFA